MSHAEPFVAPQTSLEQLAAVATARPWPEDEDAIKARGQQVGILLVNIPLWKLTIFFFRVFLAIFFASIIYAAWWFVVWALLTANGLVVTNLIANFVHRSYY